VGLGKNWPHLRYQVDSKHLFVSDSAAALCPQNYELRLLPCLVAEWVLAYICGDSADAALCCQNIKLGLNIKSSIAGWVLNIMLVLIKLRLNNKSSVSHPFCQRMTLSQTI
jgi:hypothetical protein